MAKRIRRSEISEEDLFKDIRDSANDTIKTLLKLDKVFKDIAKSAKSDLSGGGSGDAASLQRQAAAIQKANNAKKAAVKIDTQIAAARKKVVDSEIQLERIKREKLKTEREEFRNATQLRKEKERQAKIFAKTTKAVEDEKNAYKKLVKETRELKNQSKTLAAQLLALEKAGRSNTKEYRKLRTEYKGVTKAAQEGDKALKGIDARVGDNFRNVGNYTQALGKLRNGLAQLGVAFGAFSLIRGAAGIVRDFDQAQGDLLAISGKTKEELAGLTAQAKELGATTQFSATQITEMQIELAKLGFTQDQITNSTKAVANFAAATGAEIPDAAALAGSALRGFGLDASEMDRVVSTLGVATTKSALSFESLNTGLSKVAPVASAFGFSIEDTTALLGQLANAGFDASSASTATRNILLKLADSNGDLAKSLGRPITSADDLAEGLKELKAKGIDLAGALELTDNRSVAAFNTFLEGSEGLTDLRDSITDANKELQDMADKRLDTISGQFTLLQSAWEGFILSVNEGTGAGESIKNFIGFLAGNLPTIIKWVGRLIKTFIIYKTITSQAAKNTRDFAKALIQYRGNVVKLVRDMNKSKGAFRNATNGAKAFGKALKGIGLSVAISLLIEATQAFWDFASGAAGARRQQELFNKAAKKGNEQLAKLRAKTAEGYKEEINNINRLRSLNQISEKEAVRRRKAAQEARRAEIKGQIDSIKLKYADLEATRKQQVANKKKFKNEQRWYDFIDDVASPINSNEIAKEEKLADKVRKTAAKQKRLRTILKGLREDYKNVGQEVFDTQNEMNEMDNQSNLFAGTAKKINTELKFTVDLTKELNQLMGEQFQREKDINSILRQRASSQINRDLEEQIELQTEMMRMTGDADITEINSLIEQRSQLEREAVREATEFEINELKRKNGLRFLELRSALAQEEAELLSQEGLKVDSPEYKKIQDQVAEQRRNIDALEMESEKALQAEIVKINLDAENQIADIEYQRIDTKNDVNDQLLDAAREFQAEQTAITEEEAAKRAKIERKRAEEQAAIIEALTKKAVESSQKRVAQLDEEIQAAEKQQDFFRELAAKGNIDAEQSLAEQAEIEREAQKQKQQELRQQARIQLASSAYSTYQSKVAAGSDKPLAETIRDISFLQAFIQNIPLFEEGTEDTGATGKGVDGRGGFHAILHPNERVMTKQQNAMIGGLSNIELAKIAQEYNAGQLIRSGEGAVQVVNGWDNADILAKLNELNNTIKNKPEVDYRVEEVLDGVMRMRKQEKRGNTVIYNRYTFKS